MRIYKLSAIFLYYIYVQNGHKSIFVSADSTCSCDLGHTSRRLIEHEIHKPGKVKFIPAQVYGETYTRIRHGSSRLVDLDPHLLLKEQASSCNSEQIHITLGDTLNSLSISFASYGIGTESYVEYSINEQDLTTSQNSNLKKVYGQAEAHSNLNYVNSYSYAPPMGIPPESASALANLENTSVWAYDKKTGEHWANWYFVTKVQTGSGKYNNPYMYYDSPNLHTVTLTGLSGGQTYYYRVAGSCQVLSFTMPIEHDPTSSVSPYPFTIGLTADLGQTNVSVGSVKALAALQPSVVLCAGDLSYADGWAELWDSFGRMIQPLASRIPFLTTGGNHEVGSSENWLSYKARYPTPHKGSGSNNFCYWGKEVGVVHVIALCSYAGFQTDSLQYQWLSQYLSSKIDREKTPWVAVMLHTPLYNSNNGHWMEGELMRLSIEPLFYNYGVDFVLAGHVHSYERTLPMYNSTVDPCGTVYLNIGDGGNYEGVFADWRFYNDTSTNTMVAPEWSAFREASFGVAGIIFHNSTHAQYSWHRHACQSDSTGSPYYAMNFSENCVSPGDESTQAMLTSDVAWIVRPELGSTTTCQNKLVSTASTVPVAPESTNNDDDGLSATVITLTVLCCVFGASTIGLSALLISTYRKDAAGIRSSLL